jgi:hypothetical protein
MLVSMVCSQVMLLASCSLQEDACNMPCKDEEATEDFFAYPESRLESISAAADRYVQRCYATRPIRGLSSPSFVSVRTQGNGSAILIYDFKDVTDAFVAFEIDAHGSLVRAYRLRMA